MKQNLYVYVYSVTLLLSATLLFAVQPMFSKMVLPLLGGAAQVWNTAMVFFQLALLAGYAYAHATTKFLKIRTQAILQIGLLCLFGFLLPIAVPQGLIPPTDKDPTLWQIMLMLATLGGPFFVVAGSAPMLQRWFAASEHQNADNPYFLYGASNLGSMTALLSYPTIVEPLSSLNSQSLSWSFGYFLLIALTAACVWLIWGKSNVFHEKAYQSEQHKIKWRQRLHWLALAAVPSSLMLGVTTYITTDVASVPLLWILPLALYVGTFIIVFARKKLISDKNILFTLTILMCFMVFMMTIADSSIQITIGFHLTLFFFCTLACHTILANTKPDSSKLTEFYLLMSLGGALGGIFTAIIAPIIFNAPYEYTLALGLALVLGTLGLKQKDPKNFIIELCSGFSALVFLYLFSKTPSGTQMAFAYSTFLLVALALASPHRLIFTVTICICLAFASTGPIWLLSNTSKILYQKRNFYGVLKVIDTENEGRFLMHGTTLHGVQYPGKKYRTIPASYYSQEGPVGDIFSFFNNSSTQTQTIGVLGLGTGALSCYHQKNRSFEFSEINPEVVKIAENPDFFTFLSECNSPYKIIMGDGRLKIAEQPDDYYDVLFMDAFSSDNIPIHVITQEAIKLYMKKIREDGILVVHISNRHLDLEPVLAAAAESLGIEALATLSKSGEISGTPVKYFPSHYVVFTKNKSYINSLKAKGWGEARKRQGIKLWTDQYSNIFRVIGNRTGADREKENDVQEKISGGAVDKTSAQ